MQICKTALQRVLLDEIDRRTAHDPSHALSLSPSRSAQRRFSPANCSPKNGSSQNPQNMKWCLQSLSLL